MRRRDFIAASGAILAAPYVRKANAWFPHGSNTNPVPSGLTFTLNYEASWNTVANGGQFGGDGALSADQQLAAANACVTQWMYDASTLINSTANVWMQLGWGSYFNGLNVLSGGTIAGNSPFPYGIASYSNVVSYLNGMPSDPIKASAYPSIPGTNPNPSLDWYASIGHWAIMTNQTNPADSANGTYVGFSKSTSLWDYSITGAPFSMTCLPGRYLLYQVMWHEFTQALGRSAAGGINQPLDLFIFSGAGTLNFTRQTANGNYFSIDNGTTNLGLAQQSGAGDPGDFNASVNSIFQTPNPGTGVVDPFGAREIKNMGLVYPLTAYALHLAGY